MKKDFVQEQTQSMGNNGDEEEEMMKMREENGIVRNDNVKVICREKRDQIMGGRE